MYINNERSAITITCLSCQFLPICCWLESLEVIRIEDEAISAVFLLICSLAVFSTLPRIRDHSLSTRTACRHGVGVIWIRLPRHRAAARDVDELVRKGGAYRQIDRARPYRVRASVRGCAQGDSLGRVPATHSGDAPGAVLRQ